MVGHPDVGCPDSGDSLCNNVNQENEHFYIYMDDELITYVPDSQVFDHTWLTQPDVSLGIVEAGTHTVLAQHAGNPKPPASNSKSRVWFRIAFCTANP
jgi:hypothetical protein